jgi:hypothetical protein
VNHVFDPGVFVPYGPEGHEWVIVDDRDTEILRPLDGRPRADGWRAPRVELLREDLGVPLLYSDFPNLGLDALVVRAEARDAIRDVVDGYAEILPLDCTTAELWVVNVTNVVDGLDEAQSQIARFPSGRVMAIQRYAFRDEVLGHPIFKIPQEHRLFAGAALVQRIRESGLVGPEWKRIWPAISPLELDGSSRSSGDAAKRGEPRSEFEVLPVPEEARAELTAAIAKSRTILAPDGRSLDADGTQLAIHSEIERWHAQRARRLEGTVGDVAIILGAAWGDAVCRAIGWDWVRLRSPDLEELAVVAPDRSVATFPVLFLGDVLRDPNKQTTLLLYNMLKAGMAEGQPGELRLVG